MFSFIFFLTALLWISPRADAQNVGCDEKPIKLVATEYPPYQSENASDAGIFNILVEKALKAEGCKVEFIHLPWTRGLIETKNGRFDAILGIWRSAEREKFLLYSVPLIQNQLAVVKRKNDKFVFDRATVSKYTMGLVRDYAYPDDVKTLKVLRTEYAPDDRMSLLMLSGGRVDFVVLDKAVVSFLLGSDLKNIQDKIEIGDVLVKTPLYVGFSLRKDTAELLSKHLHSGLRKIDRSGEMKHLREIAKKKSVEVLPIPKSL